MQNARSWGKQNNGGTTRLPVLILERPRYAENDLSHGRVGARWLPYLHTTCSNSSSQVPEGLLVVRTEGPEWIEQVRPVTSDSVMSAMHCVQRHVVTSAK